jgi:hypothetical protein
MRIDYEYITSMLAFYRDEARTANSYVLEMFQDVHGCKFNELSDEEHERFRFHVEILCDHGLLDLSGNPFRDGSNDWTMIDVRSRMNASGHEFLSNLERSKILEKVSDLSSWSFSQVSECALEIGKAWAKKKAANIIGVDPLE